MITFVPTSKTSVDSWPALSPEGLEHNSPRTTSAMRLQEESARPFFTFPEGIMGFPAFKELEVLVSSQELPFMHLVDTQASGLEFLVVEPHGLIPGYKLEISDADVLFLDIQDPQDILVLNIVTLHDAPGGYRKVTVNLIGPLVINRQNLRGKQVVIGNYADYSAHYVLFDNGTYAHH